ncbi:MAG: hypothetical protein U1F16_02105 [Turneriella sp.]
MQMHALICFRVLCVIISGGISAETLVNRRVLLVNFVNQNKASSAEYLSVTVPGSPHRPVTKDRLV